MMKTWVLTGDIRHAGRVTVKAETAEEAQKRADNGEFEVLDEMHKELAFDHNGEEPEVWE